MTRPHLWSLFPAAFLTALSEGVVTVGWVFYARDQLGAGGAQVGWLTGLFTLVYAVSVAVLSRHYHRVNDPRYSAVPSAIVISLVVLVPVVGPQYGLLLAVTALYGALLAGVWPLAISWVSQKAEGEALSQRMGWFSITWAPGLFGGPPLAGWLYERAVAAPFVLATALVLGASALFFIAGVRPSTRRANGGGRGSAEPEPRTNAGILEQPPPTNDAGELRSLAWVATAAVFVTGGGVRALLPLWGLDDLSLDRSEVGGLLLVRPAVLALALPLLGQLKFWQYRRWPLWSSTLITAVALALVPRVGHLAAVVGLLVVAGAATAVVLQSAMFHGIAGSDSDRRAGRAAMTEMALSAGLIVGAVATGFLYEAGGAELATMSVAAAVAAAGLGMLLWRQGGRSSGKLNGGNHV